VAGFNHYPAIAASLGVALSQVVSKTAIDMVGNVQGFIRANGQIDTGFMLGSIHVEDGPDKYTKFVVCGAFYGVFQNYGTRYLPARPFWEPGIEKTRPEFDAALAAVESKFGV
jgi:hypothetical protein